MNVTPIEWTTFSANPLKFRHVDGHVMWGCVRTSPGCQHCYSEALAKRYGRGGPFTVQTMDGLTPFLDEAELHKMRTAHRIGGVAVSGSRCFIGDMTDLFGEWVTDDLLNRLFSTVLEVRTDVTWQLLTKRAERLRAYLSGRYREGRIPSRHIHVGVSVEDQHFADRRFPIICELGEAGWNTMVSLEPLLGPVRIPDRYLALGGRAWCIPGAESGHGARPMDLAWPRAILQQCQAAGVACFVKQLGAHPYVEGAVRQNATHEGAGPPREHTPMTLRDKKGGCLAEWPIDLHVREFPAADGLRRVQ